MTTPTAPASSLRLPRQRVLDTLVRFQGYFGLLIVFVLGVIFSPSRDGANLFVDLSNQMNILRYVSVTGIIAVGMTLVILTGEIDLLVGSLLAFVATLTAFLLTTTPIGTLGSFVLILLAGALLGWSTEPSPPGCVSRRSWSRWP